MQDARISTGLPGHPKTKKLLRRLGPAGPWALVCLFLWTAANRSDGNLSGMSDEDIELAADWQGDDGQLVQALASVGFLEGDTGAFVVHDWAEHNPWAAGASERSEASKWAALCKRYGRAGAAERMPDYAARMRPAPDPHAAGTNPQCDPDAPLPSPLPSPLPITPDRSSTHPTVLVGVFEGHENPQPAEIPQSTKAAIALRKAGLTVTGANPDLIAATAEGVTVDHLLETAANYPGKPARYIISAARREHADRAAPITPTTSPAGTGKQMQGLRALEAMKSANRMANGRDFDGAAEALPALVGPDSGR